MLVKTNTMTIIEKIELVKTSTKMVCEEAGGKFEFRLDGLTTDEIYEAAKQNGANVTAKDSTLDYHFSSIETENCKIFLTTKTK